MSEPYAVPLGSDDMLLGGTFWLFAEELELRDYLADLGIVLDDELGFVRREVEE